MNRYMILIYGDDEAFAELPVEQAERMITTLRPFEETVAREGKFLGTNRLMPARQATLLKMKSEGSIVMDGPFVETKEQLGGYYLVEARDELQILEWLKLIPPTMDSTFEIRGVIEDERSTP